MKKSVLILSALLLLGVGSISAKSHNGKNEAPRMEREHNKATKPHKAAPAYYVSRPSMGISVNFGGLTFWFSNGNYYREIGPSRYEIVKPPIGMAVPSISNSRVIKEKGKNLYESNGVVYEKRGNEFIVNRYM